LYLNFNRIIPDIFQVIVQYLEFADYIKLMDILRLDDYPSLKYRLSKFIGEDRYSYNYGNIILYDKNGNLINVLYSDYFK